MTARRRLSPWPFLRPWAECPNWEMQRARTAYEASERGRQQALRIATLLFAMLGLAQANVAELKRRVDALQTLPAPHPHTTPPWNGDSTGRSGSSWRCVNNSPAPSRRGTPRSESHPGARRRTRRAACPDEP
ncbi:hypothetical protein [Streptomyces sp. NPDC046727]|uniref:hypothetical protein n=1 Tax=Streptomyces sp. NPDC046727 TaxID=3155373 RepID=UPI0033FBBA59